jgi:hypothetical protein
MNPIGEAPRPPEPPVVIGPGGPIQMPRAGSDAPPIAGSDAPSPDADDAGIDPDSDGGVSVPVDDGDCPAGSFCPGTEPGCGSLRLDTDVQVSSSGNLLIVFDQSVSMRGAWEMTTKLDAARTALVAAITPLQAELTVGALFLPTRACLPRTPQGGAVDPIGDATQIGFRPATQFLQDWEQHFAMLGSMAPIGTPLNEAFDRADLAIQESAGLNLQGKLGVVVFTDGEPNCTPNPMVTGVPTLPEPERAAQWAAAGINTYVVGLPGARGVTVLNDIAVSGGTMSYLTPSDPAQLATTLRQVVEQQITRTFTSCTIPLAPAAEFPDQLQLFVKRAGKYEEIPRKDNSGTLWTISKDGAQAKLVGELCQDAEAGLFDSVRFEYGCERPPPPPPPKPPKPPR